MNADQEKIDRAEAEYCIQTTTSYEGIKDHEGTGLLDKLVPIYLSALKAERERCSDYWEQREAFEKCSEELTTLRKENELLRGQLAACGVAAMANTEESRAHCRIDKDNPYYSASYADVCAAVGREIALRKQVDGLSSAIKDYCERTNTEWQSLVKALEQHAKGEI